MSLLSKKPDDFEATIRILTQEEGGRKNPAMQGVRWQFHYQEDDLTEGDWLVFPDFLDPDGDPLTDWWPLPAGVALQARMTILADEFRTFHRERIKLGTRFYCREGSRRVAEGVVTKITGLSEKSS